MKQRVNRGILCPHCLSSQGVLNTRELKVKEIECKACNNKLSVIRLNLTTVDINKLTK